MKKLLTALALTASMALLPFAQFAQAIIVGTFTTNTTVANVSATTLAFPALSGGASASATTTISIPALSGGVDGTAEVRATGTLGVTGGTGSTTSLTVNGTEILGTSVDFTTDASTTAAALAAQINAYATASSTGYSATSVGSTITVSAPSGTGAGINGTTIATAGSLSLISGSFSGGVTSVPGTSATSTTSSFVAVTTQAGADLSLNIGSTTVTLIAGNTGAQVAAAVAAAINADSGNSYTASVVNTDQVMLTAKTSGTAGNVAALATDLDYNAAPASFASSTSGHFAAVANGSSTDLSLNIGSTTIALTGGMTAADAANTTAAAINANASSTYSASVVNTDEVKLSAKSTGTAGNSAAIATDLSYNATAQVTTFTPANITAGETYRTVINGTGYEFVANSSSTASTVTASLAPQMDANAAVSCVDNSTMITCTSETPGTSFSATAQVLGLTAPTLSPVSISSNGFTNACAKAGDTVTLSFTSSQALNASSTNVTINGGAATLTNLGGNNYSASLALNGSTTPGTLSFALHATDTNGNTASTSSTTDNAGVTFDNTAPVITLNGNSTMDTAFGNVFNDPGATTTDNSSVSATGTVRTDIPGAYSVLYTATDCAGNIATTTRIVNVGPIPIPGGHRESSGGSSSGSVGTSLATSLVLPPQNLGLSLPTIQTVLGAEIFRFLNTLKIGMRHADVLELQNRLSTAGYFHVAPTGYFGPMTFTSVKAYQKAHNIPATGLVGPMTRAALNAEASQ